MSDDLISRQAAIDALNGIINRFEQILRDIRESKVDDSVCGMCEYDGAFVGQSGDWCNECPGFEKDDCFKLSDECRKRWLESVKLPSAQQWIPCDKGEPDEDMECWVTVKTTDALYRGNFTKRYGERRDKGFITSGGFMWWNTALAWMPIYEPEPYRPEGDEKHE